MELRCIPLLTCIIFLLLNALLCLSHPSSPHESRGSKNPSPLAYLDTMTGARKGTRTSGISVLKKYLHSLGYMDIIDQANVDLFDDKLESALKLYQKTFKLNPSGVLDSQTVKMLATPRCGVPDFMHHKKFQTKSWTNPNISSLFTFFLGKPTWPPNKRILTYAFPPGTRPDVAKPVMVATSEWSKVSPFKFINAKDYSIANIKISFQIRDHGDGHPFDGPGGILAHAFAPPDGRLHYDGDEKWVDGVVPDAFDLQTISLHEVGHVLGLQHTPDSGAMYPYSSPGIRKGLGQDDINGIHALYPKSE